MSYVEFFLNSASSVVQLELIELSHPNLSKVYRIVRNAINGVTVTHEDSTTHDYDYYPLQIVPSAAYDDLSNAVQIQFGDLGEVLPTELDLVYTADGFRTKPTLVYRTYRSDDLTAPLYGPVRYVVTNIAFTKEGANFSAGAPSVNLTGTGEIYTFDRFPMLRGFL